MTDTTPQTREEIAKNSAQEIISAFRRYEGKRWQEIDGNEKAVLFEVHSPSLAGKTLNLLNPHGFKTTGDFGSLLFPHLRQLHYDPIVTDNNDGKGLVYTGDVAVSEKMNDYD